MRKSTVLATAALFVMAAALCPSPAASKDKAKGSDISVTKQTDKASPNLLRAGTAPRDPASGLPTGKRMHKPY
jgi:hypothetical protein